MNILKSFGGWLFRVIASILISATLVVAVVIGLPFMVLAILLVGIFAPSEWFENLSQEVDPNVDLDGEGLMISD